MAKDPAFLFYPNDWLGGTMGMTFEEKGAYMELLMMQFNRGHMTPYMIGQTVGQLWDNIKDKFIQDDEGRWYNERLEEEKNKRKKFVKSRNNNLSGKNQYTKQEEKESGRMGGHMSNHMENENENENKDINKGLNKKFTPPSVDEVKEYCKERKNNVDAERFINFYESKGWMVGKNKMKDWKAAVRNWESSDKQETKLSTSLKI